MVKPVAIYADQGTSEVGIRSLKLAIPKYLDRPVQCIMAKHILAGELAQYAMLIIPGGADLPYCDRLNGKGNQAIRHFVEQGGIYLGICAGAYYACQTVDFQGKEYRVCGQRELAFFDGVAQGCLPQWTNGYRFDETAHSKSNVPLHFANQTQQTFYYHGGPQFRPNPTACFEPIATYPNGELAIISGKIGRGNYLLSGVHFELQPEAYRQIVEQAPIAERTQEHHILHALQQNDATAIWQRLALLLNKTFDKR